MWRGVEAPDNFEIVDWPESRGARELYIARKPINLPHFVWFGDVAADPGLSCGPGAIMVFASNGVTIQSDSVFPEVARLFELHPKLGVLGGNVVNAGDIIIDGCAMVNARGDLESPWSGRSIHDAGPFGLARKTQQVDLPGGALAFFRIDALRAAGAWPLKHGECGEGIVWRLCKRLASAQWSTGFSPLIRGRTLRPLALQRGARPTMLPEANWPRSLIRYGICRNFAL